MPDILVVEDKDSLRKMLTQTLSGEGHRVDSAPNGKKALELIQSKSYDLVLTDLKMPEVDGMELLKWTKREKPDIPVIMITAFATVHTAVEALKIGAFDYITKPFDQDEMKMVIQHA